MADDGDDQPRSVFLPLTTQAREKLVRGRFWRKLARFIRYIPFAEDLLAAYYCAVDDRTPRRVKAILFGALAYFVVPVDLIPDFLAHLGFTDDLTVLLTAVSAIRGHIKDEHRDRARAALADMGDNG